MHPRENLVTFWSIQSYANYKKIIQGFPIQGDYTKVDQDYIDKYAWMAQKMVDFGVHDKPVCPVWAWYAYAGTSNRKPDLRRSWHLPTGVRGVRLELQLPRSHVLLSQFEMWVGVLNNNYIASDCTDWERFEQSGSSEQVRKSWCRIFDLSFGNDDYWGVLDRRAIQATLPYIKKEMIVDETTFIAR